MSAIRDIAAILEYGKKPSTSKFALLRSIVEFVMENPADPAFLGWHRIPAIWIARRFIYYYWLLTEQGIPQSRQGLCLQAGWRRFRKRLTR